MTVESIDGLSGGTPSVPLYRADSSFGLDESKGVPLSPPGPATGSDDGERWPGFSNM